MTQAIILVTGINGFIGSHVGLQLLRKGYTVRGTSRSASSKEILLAEAYKGFEDRYEHYIVPDMTVHGAFDEAVKGVQAIIHLASPLDFSLNSVDAFFGPAAGGVLSILESTKVAGSQLTSFVLTSSIAAITDVKNPPEYVYDASDWNTSAEGIARKEFSPGMAYGASKAIAERALWEWHDEHRPTFAISAVNPGLVFGAPITWPIAPAKLNESLMIAWKIFAGETRSIPPPIGGGTVVDVRDVAALHVWCAEHPKQTNGERFIAVSGKMPPQAIADLLRQHYPGRDTVEGSPGHGYTSETYGFQAGGVVTDKMYAALGGQNQVIAPARMILDTVHAFEQRWPKAIRNERL